MRILEGSTGLYEGFSMRILEGSTGLYEGFYVEPSKILIEKPS